MSLTLRGIYCPYQQWILEQHYPRELKAVSHDVQEQASDYRREPIQSTSFHYNHYHNKKL
jgi:hypothetical protein